jgi:uridine kinase
MNTMQIVPASPRREVQVTLPDGRVFQGSKGSSVESFFRAASISDQGHYLAALVDGKLRELSHSIEADVRLSPITMADSDGVRIYRRSLSFLMIVAAARCFPDSTITVHHSMPFGGYYCVRSAAGQQEAAHIDDGELAMLEASMRDLVAQDLPISQVRVPLDEALALFRESGDVQKADLFAKRRKDYLTLYELNGIRDYFHGFMVPSTGYLSLFGLHRYNNGFILRFPRRHDPGRLQPFEDEPRLANVFQEYAHWLDVIGVPGVASLNRAIREGRSKEVILVAEAFQERQLAQIATEIAGRRPTCKLVLISGPTSAGKTTFSKRLAVQLLANGIYPVTLGMDNYFLNRDKTPRDEQGDYDFETLEALDVELFRRHLNQLLAGEQIVLPRFNFLSGAREVGEPLSIGPDHVLLIEGIHGLNPRLVKGIAPEAMYRIFLSAFTQLNLDRHNRVPTTDTRLLRRIVRDASHRGYSAAQTISRWQSVRRGEKRYIFPHQNNANTFFNSALVYEVAALKQMAAPLLLQVEPGTAERIEAQRLLAFLQWFDVIDTVHIPSESILREFIGGSIMADFQPWRR